MQKKALLLSAGEYIDSQEYPKPSLDLNGVKYDILAMEKRLSQIGFAVTKGENIKKDEYIPLLQQMVSVCPNDAVHIVYFSGHGGHSNGENYLYPSDFGELYDNSHKLDTSSINLQDIIAVYKGKCRLILILDACRTDFGISKGHFSEMTCGENVYIAYGASFENPSTGINKSLSWFTEALCDEVLAPNIDVDELFTRVRQNVFIKHSVQLPSSVNTLLDKVVLRQDRAYDGADKDVYDFVQKYGDDYTDKYGYFHGDDLIFIDAAKYFDIGLLDAIWKFRKVDSKIYRDKGLDTGGLSEAEEKLVSFLGFSRSKEFFTCDEYHTWYYNGHQIRMGEIPPLPPSMQRKLPEVGREIPLVISATKEANCVIINISLPDGCEIFIGDNRSNFSQKHMVHSQQVIIENAAEIKKVTIDSGVFPKEDWLKNIIGDKCRNLTGDVIKFHPIYGNHIKCEFQFE